MTKFWKCGQLRKVTVICWLLSLTITIVLLFWYNEWVYRLPTPVPDDYERVQTGMQIDLPPSLATGSKPLFLHFYNPDCPCSRFNIPHFRYLVRTFGSSVDFVIVPISSRAIESEEIRKKFDMDIPIITDPTLARAVGVYSTPQAAILTPARLLYYRGNYNRTRYCADKKTEYARLALEALTSGETPIVFDLFALTAYGCQTPKCTKP